MALVCGPETPRLERSSRRWFRLCDVAVDDAGDARQEYGVHVTAPASMENLWLGQKRTQDE